MSRKTALEKSNPGLRQPKMQRVRHVKPEFFVHDGINDMTIPARLAEIGAWTVCDKNGAFEWSPRSLKRVILPFDNVDFESLMMEWVNHGFAERYEVDGKFYGRFFNWNKHQAINLREKHSSFQLPTPSAHASTAPARASTCTDMQTRALSEGKGKGEGKCEGEGKGEGEGEGQAAPAAQTAAAADKSTALPPSSDLKPAQEKTIAETVEFVIERAKVLSQDKAQFSKTAKADLCGALRDLGSCAREEIDATIQAKLAHCSKEDPTSYVIFGSSLASDFVATIRRHRQRVEDAAKKAAAVLKKAEDERIGKAWYEKFRATWDDISVGIYYRLYRDDEKYREYKVPENDYIHALVDGCDCRLDKWTQEAEQYRNDLITGLVCPHCGGKDLNIDEDDDGCGCRQCNIAIVPVPPEDFHAPSEPDLVAVPVIEPALKPKPAPIKISANASEAELVEIFRKHIANQK